KFLQTSALAGVGLSAIPVALPAYLKRKDDRRINLGIIGTGLRGRSLMSLVLRRQDCAVKAICDIDERAINASKKMISDAGFAMPKEFSAGEEDYLNLLEMENIDAVIIATPWRWHVPMALNAMRAGKYTGLEVSGANDIKECWDLVDVYEATKVPCMF